MASVHAVLAVQIHSHEHLWSAEVDPGESSMVLLLLWEVDHGMPFPSGGLSDTLLGFNRRLTAQARTDDELQGWWCSREMQTLPASGLAASHHMWWSGGWQRHALTLRGRGTTTSSRAGVRTLP
jgi:hypothetical protein